MKFHRTVLFLFLAANSQAFVPHQLMNPAFVHQTALEASTLERLPDSAVKVKIEIPGSATKAAYDKVCNELSSTISIPGFRKGSKIPPQVLEQAMAGKGGRNALKAQAINELLAELIEPALKEEHGLEPIGQPTLETSAEEIAKDFKPGDDLELSVKCDVWPEIEWKTSVGNEKPYLGLKGSYKRKPFDQAKFDKAMNDLKERYATLEPISDENHELQMGDACVVNMEGYMATESGEKGDKLPDAASGDRVEVIMGEGRYMTGLVEGLLGAKVGDTRTVFVTFPTVSSVFV
jgi:trigger factor